MHTWETTGLLAPHDEMSTSYFLGGLVLGMYMSIGWLVRALLRADEAELSWFLPRWLRMAGDL